MVQGMDLVLGKHEAWILLTALDYHLAGSRPNYRRPPSALLGFYEELAIGLAEYLECAHATTPLRIRYGPSEESVDGP
jgi:hypothetical protein